MHEVVKTLPVAVGSQKEKSHGVMGEKRQQVRMNLTVAQARDSALARMKWFGFCTLHYSLCKNCTNSTGDPEEASLHATSFAWNSLPAGLE